MQKAAQRARSDRSDVTGFTPVTAAPLMSAMGGKLTLLAMPKVQKDRKVLRPSDESRPDG